MHVMTKREGAVTVVTVHGDIEGGDAQVLRGRLDGLRASGAQDFVIDLADVGFMDSGGVATLLHLLKRVRLGDGDVRLCALQAPVAKLLHRVCLDRLLDAHEDRGAAVRRFAPTA